MEREGVKSTENSIAMNNANVRPAAPAAGNQAQAAGNQAQAAGNQAQGQPGVQILDMAALAQALQNLPQQLAAALPAAPGGGPAGNTRKVSTLSSTEGGDWLAWRSAFEETCAINAHWNDQRCRRELKAAMEGAAGRLVRDVASDAAPDLAGLLGMFELRFLPQGATVAAETAYEGARQLEEETILQWHSRLREYFRRARPQDDPENNRDLIKRFCLGIAIVEVKKWTWRSQPATYTQALNVATQEMAMQAQFASTPSGRQGGRQGIDNFLGAISPGNMPMSGNGLTNSVAAVRRRSSFGKGDASSTGCWHCGGNHLKRDCPTWKASRKGGRRAPRRNTRRGPGGGGTRRINSLELLSEGEEGETQSTDDNSGNE